MFRTRNLLVHKVCVQKDSEAEAAAKTGLGTCMLVFRISDIERQDLLASFQDSLFLAMVSQGSLWGEWEVGEETKPCLGLAAELISTRMES